MLVGAKALTSRSVRDWAQLWVPTFASLVRRLYLVLVGLVAQRVLPSRDL